MGKITVKTRESAGQVTYETEIVYEDSTDFFFVEEEKRTAMSQNIQNFVGGMSGSGAPYHPEQDQFEEPAKPFIKVSKKETKH